MPSNAVEIVSLIIQEAELSCDRPGNDLHDNLHMTAEAVRTSAQVSELFQLMTPTSNNTMAEAGLLLSFVPMLMDVGKKIRSQFSTALEDYLALPQQKPQTNKHRHEEAYTKTQKNILAFREQLTGLTPNQRLTMERLIIGLPSTETPAPKGLFGLKHVAESLRQLPADKKEKLVNVFTKACEQYQHTFVKNQTPSAVHLMLALSPMAKPSRLQSFFTNYLSSSGLSVEIQTLLQDPNFPQSITPDQLEDKNFLAICDPVELKKEAYLAAKAIFADPSAFGVTLGDVVLSGDETTGFTISSKTPLPSQLKSKIFAQIKGRNVIKPELLDLAYFLKDLRNTKSAEEVINKKLERIILFLHQTDCTDELASILNKLLKSIEDDIAPNIQDYCQDSLQPAYNLLSNHILFLQKKENARLQPVDIDDSPGFSYSITPPAVGATETSLALVNAEAAILFYDQYLSNESQINNFISHFKQQLATLDADSTEVTECMSFATIIRLMTMIDAKKYPAQADAYLRIFNEMRAAFEDKINQLPTGDLRSTMEFSLKIIDDLIETDYNDYLARLEASNDSKNAVCSTLRFFGQGANVVSLVASPVAVLTEPLSLGLNATAAAVDLIKEAPNHIQRGIMMSNSLSSELQVSLANLGTRKANISDMSQKNASVLSEQQQKSIQLIQQHLQEATDALNNCVSALQKCQQTFDKDMNSNPKNPMALLHQHAKNIAAIQKQKQEAEKTLSQEVLSETEQLGRELKSGMQQP